MARRTKYAEAYGRLLTARDELRDAQNYGTPPYTIEDARALIKLCQEIADEFASL